jgi:cyclopropane-fatty-acyl-phospholipid synthase
MKDNTLTRALDPQFANGLFEQLIAARLGRLSAGSLVLRHGGRRRSFGRPREGGLRAEVTVIDSSFFKKALLGGTIGGAESYVDGDWITDDLTQLMRLFVRDQSLMDGFESGVSRLGRSLAQIYHASRANTKGGSRRNISEHYDLGNDFFELMLDPTMTYSAGVFATEDSTMEEASVMKLDLLCRRLDLRPSDRLLEIGTGWGSLAIHAAEHYGCQVVTTTISARQREWAVRKIAERGLANRITVLDRDYRDLEGTFDEIVSCEMIEAVGARQYPAFFAKCESLLAPKGLLAMQAITIRDHLYAATKDEVDFIKRYIFPGSCIPSATALLDAATASSDFVLRGYEDYTAHYARTMREWRARLAPHKAVVTARYGARFWRMWSYYLAYCEAGFEEKYIGSAQLLFERTR